MDGNSKAKIFGVISILFLLLILLIIFPTLFNSYIYSIKPDNIIPKDYKKFIYCINNDFCFISNYFYNSC